MSVARSRLIQRFGRDWMIYALFHCGVEYLISQNSGFWDSLYVKLSALFDIRKKKFCALSVRTKPRHDIMDAKHLLKRVDVQSTLFGDTDYDA